MNRRNGQQKKPAEIAIIGIACRYPGVHGPRQFWRSLMSADDAIGKSPPQHSRWGRPQGGCLDAIDEFDAAFFDMAPREAQQADPQLRLFLETAWEAVEDAGVVPDRLAGTRTGVFVGQVTSNYWELLCRSTDPDIYSLVGSEFRASLPGRASFHLDLRGPSMSVDTACSASLAAVHLACQSIQLGESVMALAGGVNLALLPFEEEAFSDAGMLAADRRCKFGDAQADGFVRSEGVGVVMLKPLPHAIADGDRVYAVIRGSSVTNDGHSNGLLMTPSQTGQEHMLRHALDDAAIHPAQVDYVEAHGTGTPVGDEVELTALGNVLGEGRPPGRPCLVGSVKSNIGHTEAAAGVAGLIKAALCLHHQVVPPTLHVREPSASLGWNSSALELPTRARPLTRGDGPLVAGVSSFGITGTNVHVVLAEHVSAGHPEPAGAPVGGRHLFALSARSPETLRAAASQAADFLLPGGAGHGLGLADICHTATRRRKHHEHRLVAVGSTHEDLAAALLTHARGDDDADVAGTAPAAEAGGPVSGEVPGEAARIVFVFPGQGAQWTGMARDLLSDSPVFRAALRECSDAVEAETGWSVLDRLAGDTPLPPRARDVQPVLWAVQVALASLWSSMGVEPDLVIGHSMGEVAAVCAAGGLSVPDAAAVICRRSALTERISGRGAMLSAGLSPVEAQAVLAGFEDRVSVAAANGPACTVLSGERAALAEIAGKLDRAGVFHRRVAVDFASHSPQVDEVADDLGRALAGIRPVAGGVPVWSTMLDRVTDGACFDAAYWVRNLREPVRFASAVAGAAKEQPTVFVEISPHPILAGAVQDCLRHHGLTGTAVPSLRRGCESWPQLLESLASIHVAGGAVDWARLHPAGRPVSLPTYPWQRESYWFGRPDAAPPGPPRDPAAFPSAPSHHAPAVPVAQNAAGGRPAVPVELVGDLRLLGLEGPVTAELRNVSLQLVVRDDAADPGPQPQIGPAAQPAARPTAWPAAQPAARPAEQPAARPAARDGAQGGELAEWVMDQIARELSLPAARLNPRRCLHAMGLDSLMAARLAGRLRADAGVDVPTGLLLGERPLGDVLATIQSLARQAP
ncbi:type I polyketide synthase [Nonomuraea zeae]|uniref:Acyltransferase domain-containing protein n=1 Tax=Nonomuraea zeae TaxID=1642303 RepID=A0A5S4H3L6_9ACTN|nr:type I polyketide synthase [Nonomuraea zeae]TMR39843.1 acyltransferase domain-containing protein [Nonomuraea zeae]